MSESSARVRRWAVEFVVIAVGVFVGLAAESWAQRRGEQARADEILGTILVDLRADSVALAAAGEDIVEVVGEMAPAREALLAPDADLRAVWDLVPKAGGTMAPRLGFRSGGYRTLVSGGLLTAIPAELSAELSSLYDVEYERVNDLLGVVGYLVNDYFNRIGGVWNTASGEPRPGADVVDLANQMVKYGGVSTIYLVADMREVQRHIGAVRATILAHLAR